MEKTVTMNLRVTPAIKQQAEAVLKQLGIPMSTAINMYLRQISMKGGIPFPITLTTMPIDNYSILYTTRIPMCSYCVCSTVHRI